MVYLGLLFGAILDENGMNEVEIIKISADFLQSQLKFAIFAQ